MDKRDFQELLEQAIISAVVIGIVFHLNARFETKDKNFQQTTKYTTEKTDSVLLDSVATKQKVLKYGAIINNVKTR